MIDLSDPRAQLSPAEKKATEEAWLRESMEAIKAHNARIMERGTLLTPIWEQRESDERN